jgi:hypothetical protein
MATFTVTHWIQTTPEKVWEAYTTPELFAQFFSPEGLSIPLDSVVLEMREGGRFECTMVIDATGERLDNFGTCSYVDPPNCFIGGEESLGFTSSQKFAESDGGTLIMIEQNGLPPEMITDEVTEAFRSSFVKLGRVLGVRTENRD